MTAPTLADLRYAFFGAGEGESVSDAEYAQLLALYNSGRTLASLAAASPSPTVIGGAVTMPREDVGRADVPMTSQTLNLTYFTAPLSFRAIQVTMYSGSTAAGATPTLVRAGLYEEVTNGTDLTLKASTPNDTAIFNAANAGFNKLFSVPYDVVVGRRYALGILVVTAAAAPTGNGHISPAVMVNRNKLVPLIVGSQSGLSDLPSSITGGLIAGNLNRFYAEVLP